MYAKFQYALTKKIRPFFVAVIFIGIFSMANCGVRGQSPTGAQASALPITSKRVILSTNGPNDFEVACDKIETDVVKQHEERWCWAACAEMLFKYNGYDVSQEEIVDAIGKQTKPGQSSQSANMVEIWEAMNPDLMKEMKLRQANQITTNPNSHQTTFHWGLNGRNTSDVMNSLSTPSTDLVVQEMSAGNLVFVGLRGGQWGGGHVVLAYGVDYSWTGSSMNGQTPFFARFAKQFKINRLLVIDPDTNYCPSPLRQIEHQDFSEHVDFIEGKADARKRLQSYMKVFLPTSAEQQNSKPQSFQLFR